MYLYFRPDLRVHGVDSDGDVRHAQVDQLLCVQRQHQTVGGQAEAHIGIELANAPKRLSCLDKVCQCVARAGNAHHREI
jgi:hypothetical protein